VTLVAAWAPLATLVRFSLRHEHYSHIVLIPLVSLALLVLDRRRVLARVETGWRAGGAPVLAGAVLHALGRWWVPGLSENDALAVTVSGVVMAWLGAFVTCYGLAAFRGGLFPLLFLFLVVPIPDAVLNRVIVWLQTQSAEVTAVLFDALGVPVFRSGFTFLLPGVSIEVARECSGIRSSLAMLITSLLAGHLALRTPWAKGALCLATVPLLVVKNGIRIVTLTLLTIYVDPRFLTGSLHQQGGIVFFALALLLLAPVLGLLRYAERAGVRGGGVAAPDVSRS
jgi:exosortase